MQVDHKAQRSETECQIGYRCHCQRYFSATKHAMTVYFCQCLTSCRYQIWNTRIWPKGVRRTPFGRLEVAKRWSPNTFWPNPGDPRSPNILSSIVINSGCVTEFATQSLVISALFRACDASLFLAPATAWLAAFVTLYRFCHGGNTICWQKQNTAADTGHYPGDSGGCIEDCKQRQE